MAILYNESPFSATIVCVPKAAAVGRPNPVHRKSQCSDGRSSEISPKDAYSVTDVRSWFEKADVRRRPRRIAS